MRKNSIKYGACVLMMLLMAVSALTLSSCSDDDSSSGGVPEITGVRVPDPAKADSLFTKSGPGQIIVVLGKNLGGALHLYINGQEVTFNPTMNTDHSIIVTVPTEEKGFKLSAFDSDIPDEIRVVTSGGEAVYSFKITAPYPVFTRIEADYPRNPGDVLHLHGKNLVDIENIYITDLTADELAETEWKEIGGNHVAVSDYKIVKQDHALNPVTNSYETASVVEVTVPEGAPDNGVLVIETAAGIVYLPYNRLPGVPVILTCSTDMPQIGETLVITGREFVQVESVTYGDVTVAEDGFRVSESQDTIYIDFAKKPSAGSGTTLTVTTPGGSASVDRFYDYTTILTTFDGDAVDNGWIPDAAYVDGGTSDGIYAHINVPTEYQQWWGTMVYFRKDFDGNSFALSDNIPANASASDIYFAYNVYDNNSDYNNGTFLGYLRYMIQPLGDAENQYDSGFGWKDYDAGIGMFEFNPLGDINGKNPKGKWYRVVVSLDKFACYQGLTWSDIKTVGLNQFRIQSINQSTVPGKVDVKIDNVRVIYIPSK